MRAVILAAVLVGCGAPYRPGALLASRSGVADPSIVRTVGCVDFSVRVVTGDIATARGRTTGRVCAEYEARPLRVPATSAIVTLKFGNRCPAPARLDLQSLGVRGVYEDGVTRAFVLYNPRFDVRPGELDPYAQGEESLEFDPPFSPTMPLDGVCIDLAGVTEGPGTTLCFDRDGRYLVPSDEEGS